MGDVNGHRRTPYEEMQELLAELNAGVKRGQGWRADASERGILAMARQNDPFYAGVGCQLEPAQWFAEIYHRLGFGQRRVHIRFLHYVFAGEEEDPETGEKHQERLPDGKPYENTEENWLYIQEAARFARNIGLVDPYKIIDRRASRKTFNAPSAPATEPYAEAFPPSLTLPAIDVEALRPELEYAYALSYGYSYDAALEPSLVEVWVEKELDDEDAPIIGRLCEELSVNLITGTGFMPISAFYAMLERRARLGKPLRILYLSDFDPAGNHMPVSPARHIEFAIRSMDPKPDIRLHHFALTHEQVRGVPRMPIKETDRRKANFEAKHGEGAVELNAMMHETRVDDFEQMLRDAILGLRDGSLRTKLRRAWGEASNALDEELERQMRWPHRALQLIEEEARQIGERYTAELEDIAHRLSEEIAPLQARAERVRLATRRRLERVEGVELPEVEDLGEEPEDAAEDWLFDSRRDYFDQLEYYKAH